MLKHGVLTRYAPPFVAKVGSTSDRSRVVVLDGYAGEGRYADGTDGSPIFFVETARRMAPTRVLELIFVEKERSRFQKLQEVLAAEAAGVTYSAWHGPLTAHLDAALAAADGLPLFAFLDPCGVGLPFTDITAKIFGRPSYQYAPATEVLLNFSAEAVRRIGGRLKESEGATGREATLALMDSACGGDWWRSIYLDSASPEQANEQIAHEFARRLREASGSGGWVIGVRNAPNQQPKYALVFLSRHRDGLYLFGEAASGAQADWRRATTPPDTLLSDEESIRAAEKRLDEQWTATIAKNLTTLLKINAQFTVQSVYADLMGETLGLAREKHIRAALKQLQKAGLVSSNCVGEKLQRHLVVRA